MHTLRNQRLMKSRMSASWPHDRSHYRFERIHRSQAPFVEPESANRFADVVVGIIGVVGLVAVIGFSFGGW